MFIYNITPGLKDQDDEDDQINDLEVAHHASKDKSPHHHASKIPVRSPTRSMSRSPGRSVSQASGMYNH